MPQNIGLIRGRGQKVFTSPNIVIDGKPLEYRIRKLTQLDMTRIGLIGLVASAAPNKVIRPSGPDDVALDPDSTEAKIKQLMEDPTLITGMGDVMRKAIEIACVDPRISCVDDYEKTPANYLHISDIAEDESVLSGAIMEFSGLNSNTQQVVDELSDEKKSGTSSSTGSPDDTGNSPTKS